MYTRVWVLLGAANMWSTLVMIHRLGSGQAKTYRIEEPTCLLATNEKSCSGFYSDAKTIRIRGQLREMVIERGSIIVVAEH